MKINTDTQENDRSLIANPTVGLKTLKERSGPLKQFLVRRATSRAAGNALTRLEVMKIEGEEDIARTGISLAVAKIKTAMLSNAMPEIGALTTRLNAATTAVDQALTNGGLAEMSMHMNNRAANKKLFGDLKAEGKITGEEKSVLDSFAEEEAVKDIERTRNRNEDAKAAVATLHSYGLTGVVSSKEYINKFI